MVLVIRVRSMRACRLGRYSNFLAASRTRSLVAGEIDFATGELLRTIEIVAGERSRYSARVFSVTGLPASGLLSLFCAFIMFRQIFLLSTATVVHPSSEDGEQETSPRGRVVTNQFQLQKKTTLGFRNDKDSRIS